MKVGHYEPRTQTKGKDEAFIDNIEEGEVYWVVQLDKDTQLDVKTQIEAEIISKLVLQSEEIKLIKSIMRQKEDSLSTIFANINDRLEELNTRFNQHIGIGDICPHTGRK